jgi:hypothetical protein
MGGASSIDAPRKCIVARVVALHRLRQRDALSRAQSPIPRAGWRAASITASCCAPRVPRCMSLPSHPHDPSGSWLLVHGGSGPLSRRCCTERVVHSQMSRSVGSTSAVAVVLHGPPITRRRRGKGMGPGPERVVRGPGVTVSGKHRRGGSRVRTLLHGPPFISLSSWRGQGVRS